MTDDNFTDRRDLLESLYVVNARDEKAEDSEMLVKFAAETMREHPGPEGYAVVRDVMILLSELGRFRPSNEAILLSRDTADSWKSELIANLDSLVQLDLHAKQFNLPVGHFYFNDTAIRVALELSLQMVSVDSMRYDQTEELVRKKLAGEGKTYEARLAWVLQLFRDSSEHVDVSGMVGSLVYYDRPKGGGGRSEHDISLAHACRRLNAALPEFAKERWAFQGHLLEWAGLGKVQRYLVKRAVVGNKFRQ